MFKAGLGNPFRLSNSRTFLIVVDTGCRIDGYRTTQKMHVQTDFNDVNGQIEASENMKSCWLCLYTLHRCASEPET